MTLSRLFEQELGVSFTKTDLAYVQKNLPKLLIEDMELAETAEIQIQNDKITLEIPNSTGIRKFIRSFTKSISR